jgi:AGCS family alanine or glycine:cation symporter
MELLLTCLQKINQFLWGGPMIFLLLGTHLYFTYSLHFVQRKIKKAIRLSLSSDTDSNGNASSFSTLTTTLAATLGTGNIIGISTAIALGGPGAVFWCWITGILGMATTYAECYLGIFYRVKDSNGNYHGGPMYAIEYGLKNKPLAIIFSCCTILTAYGMGCSTQSHAISDVAARIGISPYLTGIITSIIIGLVLIGGVSWIQKFCMKLVPAMALFYIVGCFFILCINYQYLYETIKVIFMAAFAKSAIAGGIIGGSFHLAARYGISRGLFTNEAGLGSAAIAAADTKNENPKEQSLVSMSATFWDTVVMCAITGLVIVSTILKQPGSIEGLSYSEFATAAFAQLPLLGTGMLSVSLVAFATATLIGWSYFGEKAVRYLFGTKGISIYRLGYILMIFFGCIMSLDLVWEGSDFVNAMMAIPNVLAIILLRKKIQT